MAGRSSHQIDPSFEGYPYTDSSAGLPERYPQQHQFIEQPAGYRKQQNKSVHPSSSGSRNIQPHSEQDPFPTNRPAREAQRTRESDPPQPVRKAQTATESNELAVRSPSNDPYSTKAAYQTVPGGIVGNNGTYPPANMTGMPTYSMANHSPTNNNAASIESERNRQKAITARQVSFEISIQVADL